MAEQQNQFNQYPQISDLENRIEVLEDLLRGQGRFLETDEKFRDIIFPDFDQSTVTTQTIGAGGGTVPKNPDLYIRVYFRGTLYNVPVYKLV